jgi:hypothetical protein
MAVSLATSLEPSYARIRLTVSGATGAEATISRIDPDNSIVPVRSAAPLEPISGTAEVYDYEAPLNVPVKYQVDDGATVYTTSTMTLTVTQAWLKSPHLPTLNVLVKLREMPAFNRSRPRGVHRVLNRSKPIVTSGKLSGKEGNVTFLTGNDTAYDAMEAFLSQTSVALLQIPGSRFNQIYLALGDVNETPLTKFQQEDSFWWSFDVVEVETPTGDLEGNPTSTYNSLKDGTITNYTNLKTVKSNYLAVMRGSGIPITPPNPGTF